MREWFIGVDPGLVTGIALVQRDHDSAMRIYTGEVKPEEIAPLIRPWLLWWHEGGDNPRMTVVMEAYVITARTATLSSQPWSLEHIGLVKQCMRDAGMDLEEHLVMQKPAVKAVVDNPKLKRIGLWHRGGDGHANDALRHVVVRMINVGWRDPRLLDSNVREPLAMG